MVVGVMVVCEITTARGEVIEYVVEYNVERHFVMVVALTIDDIINARCCYCNTDRRLIFFWRFETYDC